MTGYVGGSMLPQSKPVGAPEWSFWLETNAVFGWITSREAWMAARDCYPSTPASRFKQAQWTHPALIAVPQSLSFGLCREHEGPRTLEDHAKDFGLEWLT